MLIFLASWNGKRWFQLLGILGFLGFRVVWDVGMGVVTGSYEFLKLKTGSFARFFWIYPGWNIGFNRIQLLVILWFTLRISDPWMEKFGTCVAGLGSSKSSVLRAQWSLGHYESSKELGLSGSNAIEKRDAWCQIWGVEMLVPKMMHLTLWRNKLQTNTIQTND